MANQTQPPLKSREISTPARGDAVIQDKVAEGRLHSHLEVIEAMLGNVVTKSELVELRDLLEDRLLNRGKYEAEREDTARALVSVYDSLVLKYLWLNQALSKPRVRKRTAGREYKELLRNCFVALAREILGLLGRYGIQVFCDTGDFNAKRHMAVSTKLTRHRELHGKIAKVKRKGFLQSKGENVVVFRPEIVVVYKCTDI